METLKVNSKYLVKSRFKNLIELTVLEITGKAIKVKYEYGTPSWLLKEDFDYTIIEELPTVKETIEDKSHEIQFDDDMWCEKDEPQFTLKMTEEKDIEVKLKVEEKSKLEWQDNPPEKPMSWHDAMEYARTLGYGWILPTKEQLKHAYDNDLEGFQSTDYWSSSTYAQDTTNAWYVDFDDGGVYDYSKASDSYVRCVRYIKEETVRDRESFWEIKDLKEVQEKSALSDDYNLGLYNGMELCLSILEKREPKYKDLPQADRRK